MMVNLLNSKKRRQFIRKMLKQPQGNHWYINSKGNLFLFDSEARLSVTSWNVVTLTQRLNRMISNIQESGLNEMRIEGVMVECHVAADLWLAGELTTQDLQNAKENYHGIDIEDYKFGDHVFPLMIRRGLYFESYQFSVTGHPENFEVARDQQDLLAAIAGEKVL